MKLDDKDLRIRELEEELEHCKTANSVNMETIAALKSTKHVDIEDDLPSMSAAALNLVLTLREELQAAERSIDSFKIANGDWARKCEKLEAEIKENVNKIASLNSLLEFRSEQLEKRPKSIEGLGSLIYGIELKHLYIMAAMAGAFDIWYRGDKNQRDAFEYEVYEFANAMFMKSDMNDFAAIDPSDYGIDQGGAPAPLPKL